MKSSILAAFLLILLGFVVWLGSALVRVENERYALEVGLCQSNSIEPQVMFKCLKNVETRTGWWWHIFYALKG